MEGVYATAGLAGVTIDYLVHGTEPRLAVHADAQASSQAEIARQVAIDGLVSAGMSPRDARHLLRDQAEFQEWLGVVCGWSATVLARKKADVTLLAREHLLSLPHLAKRLGVERLTSRVWGQLARGASEGREPAPLTGLQWIEFAFGLVAVAEARAEKDDRFDPFDSDIVRRGVRLRDASDVTRFVSSSGVRHGLSRNDMLSLLNAIQERRGASAPAGVQWPATWIAQVFPHVWSDGSSPRTEEIADGIYLAALAQGAATSSKRAVQEVQSFLANSTHGVFQP